MVPGVAGSIPVGHPESQREWWSSAATRSQLLSEVRSSIGRAPVSKTGGWGFDSLRACSARQLKDLTCLRHARSKRNAFATGNRNCRWAAEGVPPAPPAASAPTARRPTAVSSRGLGHGPLKAGTRVRIPLPLLEGAGHVGAGAGRRSDGSIVYRLGHDPFKVERRVRLPLELWLPWRGLRGVRSVQVWYEGSTHSGKQLRAGSPRGGWTGGVAQFG